MSQKQPQDRKRKLKPGQQRFRILGVEVVVDFNDRKLVRDILDIYERTESLKDDEGGIKVAREAMELVDEADAIVTRAVGQTARDKMFGKDKEPIKEPFEALYALVTPAGAAYDEMLSGYTAKQD